MNEDMSSVMNQINQMLKNNEIPDEIKSMVNQLSSSQATSQGNASDISSSHASEKSANEKAKEQASPINQKSSDNSVNGNSSNGTDSNQTDNGFPNFDMNTMLKMKSIMDSMNKQKDDPRANLLMSLKPYLKSSRKEKVDQYVKLFQMGKVFEMINPLGGEKKS